MDEQSDLVGELKTKLKAEERKNERMNEEMDKLYKDLNQETDTNHNLLESIEVSRQEVQIKTEEMEEEIQSRDVLI